MVGTQKWESKMSVGLYKEIIETKALLKKASNVKFMNSEFIF